MTTSKNELAALSLVNQIKQCYEMTFQKADEALDWAIRCGEFLTQAKQHLGHGAFGGFVEQNFDFCQRRAQDFMKLYKDLHQLPNTKRSSLLKSAGSVNSLQKMLPHTPGKGGTSPASGDTSPEAPESPQNAPAPDCPDESPEAAPAPEATGEEPTTPSKGEAKVSAAALVDDLTKKHVGHMARGLTTIAMANGGEGAQFQRGDRGLNEMIAALQEMRAGKQ